MAEDNKIFDFYDNKLNELKNNSSFRSIKNIKEKFSKYIIVDDKKMLNLSSNDYLNISTDSDLKLEFIDKYKYSNDFIFSSASARLLSGSSSCYKNLENKIAKLFQKDASLLFNTGYQCNQGVVSTLFSKNDLIISDKLNHASIVSGLKLSSAEHIRYKHNDYDNLEKILKEKRNNYNNAIIISESVFSMDGDCADIKKLIELKKKYNCMLMIDEAHAFLCFGNNLLGLSDGINSDIDIITITLGKALGSFGALCISNNKIINYLINKASSFIFSTAIAPVNVLWSYFLLDEKFDVLKNKKEKLNHLFNRVHKLFPTISQSQIIPIVLKDSVLTKKFALDFQNRGYFTLPINPPTVPINTSRLRISLTSDIEYSEIEQLFLEAKNAISMVK